jgi:hypothetical protein
MELMKEFHVRQQLKHMAASNKKRMGSKVT